MINVNISEQHLQELLLDGYLIEHEENLIKIRSLGGKAMAEIMYFEETNNILISTERKFIWCTKIIDIQSSKRECFLISYTATGDNKQRTILAN